MNLKQISSTSLETLQFNSKKERGAVIKEVFTFECYTAHYKIALKS